MQILNYDDPDDPWDREIPLGDPASVRLAGLRVVLPEGPGITLGVSAELLDARERAAAVLAAQGARIVRTKPYALIKAQLIFIEALRSSWNDEFVDSIGWEARRVRELYRELRSEDATHTPAFVNLAASVSLVGRLRKPTPADAFTRAIDRLSRQVADEIGDGVMLLPPMPRPARRTAGRRSAPGRWARWCRRTCSAGRPRRSRWGSARRGCRSACDGHGADGSGPSHDRGGARARARVRWLGAAGAGAGRRSRRPPGERRKVRARVREAAERARASRAA